ncbi:MAG: dephospho-CoA kinase, partial [Aquificaceae bacterium]
MGLTGNLGCGKSTVAKMFKELSLYVFDADEIIKGFYEERKDVYRKVVEAFGDSI